MQVRNSVWPPGALMITLPKLDPSGQDSAPPPGPAGPVAPVAPGIPCGPGSPCAPFGPTGPAGPVAPVGPVAPPSGTLMVTVLDGSCCVLPITAEAPIPTPAATARLRLPIRTAIALGFILLFPSHLECHHPDEQAADPRQDRSQRDPELEVGSKGHSLVPPFQFSLGALKSRLVVVAVILACPGMARLLLRVGAWPRPADLRLAQSSSFALERTSLIGKPPPQSQ